MVGFLIIDILLGTVGPLVVVIGWLVSKSIVFLFIGIGLWIAETIFKWTGLTAGAIMTDISIFGLGCIVSLFITTPWYICGMFAICVYSAVIGLISLPTTIGIWR